MLPCKIWNFLLQECSSYANFSIIWYGMVQFCYDLVLFGIIPHHLVRAHCKDMLPCKIWSLYLQKCSNYANFSIIWYSNIWFGYILVFIWYCSSSFVVCLLSKYLTMLNLYLVASKMTEIYPFQYYYVWFGLVWYGLEVP